LPGKAVEGTVTLSVEVWEGVMEAGENETVKP
jgi:hypothetical protein